LPSSTVPIGASGAMSTEGCIFSSLLSLIAVSSSSSTCYSVSTFSANASTSNSSVTIARFSRSEFIFASSLARLTLRVTPYHSYWLSWSTVIGSATVSSVVTPTSFTVISPTCNNAISATTSSPFNLDYLAHDLYNYHLSSHPKGSIT
jgi:hypothetical protein